MELDQVYDENGLLELGEQADPEDFYDQVVLLPNNQIACILFDNEQNKVIVDTFSYTDNSLVKEATKEHENASAEFWVYENDGTLVLDTQTIDLK